MKIRHVMMGVLLLILTAFTFGCHHFWYHHGHHHSGHGYQGYQHSSHYHGW